MSKMTVKELSNKFRLLIGDSPTGDESFDIPDSFIINSINWAFNDLPKVPKLGKLFSKHYHSNLDANGHYRWNLNRDFRRIIDLPLLAFYTSTGGEPCKLQLCYHDPDVFYEMNGLVNLKEKGKPCSYTIEEEDDNVYLVVDRPSNIPIIVDYIAYGFPKPVTSIDDEIEISAIAENLILSVMKTVWYQEADDFNFSGDISDYVDNKLIPEALQALYHRYGSSGVRVLGEN